jgi:hypothetical protein
MVQQFPGAQLIERAGLFSHEERPGNVVRAMLPTLSASRWHFVLVFRAVDTSTIADHH